MSSADFQYDYFAALSGDSVPKVFEADGGLRTHHPTYYKELNAAVINLTSYFTDYTTDGLPLNSMILGPTGAGKIILARTLAKSFRNCDFRAYDLSSLTHPDELRPVLSAGCGLPRLILLNEFDAMPGDSNVARYLLNCMTSRDYPNTAFVFTGRHLKTRAILNRLQSNLSDFDLPLFLAHLFTREHNPELRQRIGELYELCVQFKESRETFSIGTETVTSLSQLHRLRDFLFRMNGFVLEIPDIASPVMFTSDPLRLSGEPKNGASDFEPTIHLLEHSIAPSVLAFARDRRPFGGSASSKMPSFEPFKSPTEVLLQFKHMLLTERLRIVREFLREYIANHSQNDKSYFISRQTINYLTLVPLQNSLRSLKALVEQCLTPTSLGSNSGSASGQVELRIDPNPSFLQIHIAKDPYFQSPRSLWWKMTEDNRKGIVRDDGLICLSRL